MRQLRLQFKWQAYWPQKDLSVQDALGTGLLDVRVAVATTCDKSQALTHS